MTTTSDVVNSVNWTEKYRPKQLVDVALEDDNRAVLAQYLSKREIPHLLLSGPQGSGKTTVARIVTSTLDCSVLSLNASSERGIDTVRDKIGAFAGSMGMALWNIVFLDESDAMTADAQTALRNMMEAYSDHTRFIMTANYLHKIIAPIQSRCQVLTLGQPPLKERFRILTTILLAEGIISEPQTTFGYAERYPDMRRMLWAAQKAVLTSKNGTLPPASSTGAVSGAELYAALLNKEWRRFTALTQSGDFDCLQLLRELFWTIPDHHAKAFPLRHLIGKGVHETGFSPDPIVLFLGTISGAMDIL